MTALGPEIIKSLDSLKAKPVKWNWFKRWKMNMLLQWLEGQIIKAKWSWSTSIPSVLGGIAALLSEVSKMFDGDPKTVPNVELIGLAMGLIITGWNAKSSTNTGLAPKKTASKPTEVKP